VRVLKAGVFNTKTYGRMRTTGMMNEKLNRTPWKKNFQHLDIKDYDSDWDLKSPLLSEKPTPSRKYSANIQPRSPSA